MVRYWTQAALVILLVIHAFSKIGSIDARNGNDMIIEYNGNNVSTIAVLQRLNITGNFRFGALCPKDEHSCKIRCLHGVVDDQTERQNNLPCYCDRQCLDVGDCCYDFFSSCTQVQQHHDSQRGQWECVNMKNSGNHGNVMKTKCPQGIVEPELQPLCETMDDGDLLRGMPVVDEQTGVVYRNVFCARCNSIQTVSYWRMTADCGRIPTSALPQDNALLLAFIRENCTVRYTPTDGLKKYLKNCLAAESTCSSRQIVEKEPVLQELCSYYAFSVCGNTSRKNIHCALCNGHDITQYNCGCLTAVTSDPPKHSTTPSTTPPPHSTTPGTTPPPHSTTPGTTPPPHSTTPGTIPPPHSNTTSTTPPPHSTTPGTSSPYPPHSTTPGTIPPPHSKSPGTASPPPPPPPTHSTTRGTIPPPHATTPRTTAPPHASTPGTTPPPYATAPEKTATPYATIPGTIPPWHTTSPGRTSQWYTSQAPYTYPLTQHKTSLIQTPTTPIVSQQPPPPPLSILFDFSSNKMSIQGTTTKTKVVEQKSCQEGFVYDPFVGTCREAFRKVILNTNSSINSTNSTTDVIMLNCSVIQLNSSDTVLYPNGTLLVPLYATQYNITDYFMNGSYAYLCTDFVGNYSRRGTIATLSYVVSPLQIVTYAGCSVSVLSLLILLVIYCIFKELRTLPGKNLINLSFAMICYHIFLFVAGFRNIQVLCTGIAILLHYFLLCSFAWMTIMAFDVAKTFVFRDNDVRSKQAKKRRKTLLKYCVCAWGLPAIVVLACFTLDYKDTVKIGYGRGGFCWVQNGTALLVIVGVPVALVILFNFVALTWTVISIYKVRKVTNKLAVQRGHSSLAVLYIKLTCVLGLTWVFGFLNSIVKADVTAYLFVAVNSLQGFFICLTFIAKKRTVVLLRGAIKKHHHESGTSNNTLDTKL